jgi:hypothetical protein
MALGKAEFEQAQLQTKTLLVNVGIWTNTTQASIKTYCKNIPTVLVYHEDDSRTVTAVDSGIGFALTDLDNDAAPAVVGFLVPVGDAAELVGVELVTNSITSTSMTAPMTALGTVTKAGASSTGVTTSSNLAFYAALTSLNIDEDDAASENNAFWLRVTYRPTQPGR